VTRVDDAAASVAGAGGTWLLLLQLPLLVRNLRRKLM